MILSSTVESRTRTRFAGAKGPGQYVRKILKHITSGRAGCKIIDDIFIPFQEESSAGQVVVNSCHFYTRFSMVNQ